MSAAQHPPPPPQPWLGALSPEVAAQHPEFCFLPRIAALELSELPLGAARGADAARGIHALRRDLPGEAHFMLHFTRGAATPGLCLPSLGLWDAALGASAATRVVLSCVPDALVPAACAALVAVGRAATFRERCLTWEPAPGSLCGSGDADALQRAAEAALPPGYALDALRPDEAKAVDDAWKYRCEGVTLRMVQEAIAARPSVCIRRGGQAVCWSVLRSDCSWGLLYTLPAHRRLGLSRAAMLCALGRQRAWALGLPHAPDRALACAATPYVHIARHNAESSGLFRSLGFVPTATATWVISNALAPRFQLRPLRLHCALECAALLAHVNASYKQDDAFFVDQQRTTAESLAGMAREGVFYVGFELAGAAGQVGLSSAPHPAALASSAQAPEAEAPRGEGSALLASVYIKITPAPGGAGAAAAPAAPAAAAAATAASPFAADSRRGGGGGSEGAASEGAAASATASAAAPSGAAPADLPLAPPVPAGPTASFSLLTIAPAAKRLGLGQRVLDFCLATCRDTYRCAAAEVFIVSVKPWLLAFYEHNGFKVVGAEAWPPFLEHQLVQSCYFKQARLLL